MSPGEYDENGSDWEDDPNNPTKHKHGKNCKHGDHHRTLSQEEVKKLMSVIDELEKFSGVKA